MTLPSELAELLPAETQAAWPMVAAAAPADGTLMGGTALAVHLHHRVSRDLDLFTTDPFDAMGLAARLAKLGRFAVVSVDDGTLNGVLGGTKVQFLHARGQVPIEEPIVVAGMRVGSLADVLATKVKVISDRGELRDYFDLMVIEERTGRTVEEGIGLYLHRYGLPHEHASVRSIVLALGHFDDVEADPYLEAECGDEVFDVVAAYWRRRQPEVVAHLDRYGPV